MATTRKKPERTQTEQDLMELEAALQIAHRGGTVIWASAQDALRRLYQRYVPDSNYEPTV